MLSPSLCLPPPPPSFCPQSLLPLALSLSPSISRHRNKITLISGHFSSSPVLFSALITAVKTNPAPTLSPPTPASFVLSALSVEGVCVGGGLVQPVANCPSEGSVYVMGSCCSHQRIHSETQRHLARRILALSPDASLPGWWSTESC